VVQVILMFFLFRRLMEHADPHPSNIWVAALAAACYGLHPANAETVNYIIQRGDLYNALGVVASLLCFAVFPAQRKWGWYLLPAIAAYFSKSPALIFPLILLVYVFLLEQEGTFNGSPKNRGKWMTALMAAVPALVVAAIAGLITWKMTPAAYSGGANSPWLYRATQPWVALRYFKSFFLPTGLSADTDWTVVESPFAFGAIVGYLFVAGMLWVAWRTSKRRETRPIAFGIVWFFLALLPTSLMALSDVTNDHRMFFPFVGLTLAVFWEARLVVFRETARLTANRVWVRGALAVAGVALVLAGIGTHMRNEVWRTDETLWQDVTVKSPKNARGQMNYGLVFLQRREFAKAIPYLETAQLLNPTYGPVEANLGVALAGIGNDKDAVPHFRKALQLAPGLAEPHIFYARWLLEKNYLPEAQAQLLAALQTNKFSIPARDLLMEVYAKQGNRQAAEKLLRETVTLAFNTEVAERYMAERERKAKEARAAQFPPNLTPVELVDLSAKYCSNHQFDYCLAAAQRAIDLQPRNAEAYNNMSAAFLSLGRWDEGIEAARQALQIKPNSPAGKSNLAWGMAQKAKEIR